MGQRPDNNVGSHAQCRLTGYLRVIVDMCILPAISQIGLIRIEDDDAVAIEQSKCLWPLAIMFVNFRQSLREFEMTTEKAVIGGQFDEALAGIQALHFPAEGLVHTIIVVGMKKATGIEIVTESIYLRVCEENISVSGHV